MDRNNEQYEYITSQSMPEVNNRNIHSEEVQELMGKIPGWIIRWGLTLVFLIFGALVIGSYFFKYPEVVSVPMTIMTYNTPAVLEPRSTGKIEGLLVENGQEVSEGQLIAVVNNPATYTDVISLKETLATLPKNNDWIATIESVDLNVGQRLGELQAPFASFQKGWQQFDHYLEQGHLNLKIKLLDKQIIKQQEIYIKQLQQFQYQKEDLELTYNSFSRDSTLFSQGGYALTLAEYERSKQTLVQKRSAFASFEGSLKSSEAGILRLKENKIELRLQLEFELNQYQLDLDEGLKSLLAAIEQWERQYLLISPIEGKVTFTNYWSENQQVKAGTRLATIVPLDETKIFAKAIVPHASLGKIEIGQKVHIKLSGFPFMEFGVLEGSVSSISLVPEEDGYVAGIGLEEGMTTNYKQQLRFIQEMQGTAEIITKDRRLIERFVQPVVAIFRKNVE